MNTETQKMLEILAQKLGTTVDYLWQVLIDQAKLDAITTLAQYVLLMIFGIILLKMHKRFLKPIDPEDTYRENLYDKHEGGLVIPMAIGLIIFLILSFIAFFSISDVVNAIFNPEYWALERVMRFIK